MPMEADAAEEPLANGSREHSPAGAAADGEDESEEEFAPARRRSRSRRQSPDAAAATQLPASQALTQRGTQRALTQITRPRVAFPMVRLRSTGPQQISWNSQDANRASVVILGTWLFPHLGQSHLSRLDQLCQILSVY